MSIRPKYSRLPKQKQHFPLTGFSRLTIGLFLIGFLAGCVTANLLENSLYAPALTLFQNTVSQISSLDINRNDVFLYSMKENIKYFLLLLFFALTNVWRLYYTGYTLYTGFSHGLLCTFCMLLYHAGGVMEYFCFLLPQALLLVPAFLYLINHMETLHRDWFSSDNREPSHTFLPNAKKRQLLVSKLPVLLICLLLLVCSALLEGYLNIPLLKYYHSGL